MIPPRSRVGLVGDNGAGKTTLLRAITGNLELDSGKIDIVDRKNTSLGYLPQDLIELEPVNILDFLKKRTGLFDLEIKMKTCEEQVSLCPPNDPEYKKFLKNYEMAVNAFQIKDGYSFDARARQMLHGFGFRESVFQKSARNFPAVGK
jgi:ATP-binding cassette subfamily F protein 3